MALRLFQYRGVRVRPHLGLGNSVSQTKLTEVDIKCHWLMLLFQLIMVVVVLSMSSVLLKV